MDLAKFISLLANQALYFTNPKQFNDPYEFYLPESHQLATQEQIINPMIKNFENIKKQMLLNKPGIDKHRNWKEFEEKLNKLPSSLMESQKQVKERFGVSCWHINDFENESLWKIYTNQGQGIAIETTIEKLEQSLSYHRKIIFDKVRYEDFKIATIEKGHKHYGGFIKRKAFEYEKEFRAMVLLNEEDYRKGCYVKTDLNKLIEKIHISPLMPKYFLDSIKYLCQGELSFLQEKIIKSNLYDIYENK